MPEPYSLALGDAWATVPAILRRVHSVGRSKGGVRIAYGRHKLCPLIARLAGFPPASEDATIELQVTRRGSWNHWQRRMGDGLLVTYQAERNSLLVERSGLFEMEFRVTFDGNSLLHRQVATAIAWGPIRIPLPRWLGPRALACAGVKDSSTTYYVEIAFPVVGTILVYEGTITPEAI